MTRAILLVVLGVACGFAAAQQEREADHLAATLAECLDSRDVDVAVADACLSVLADYHAVLTESVCSCWVAP